MPKIIVISGGSDGLGREIAQTLSVINQVVILARNEEKLKVTAAQINADFVVADVSDYASVEKAIAHVVTKYGRIDCLINSAGVWAQGQITDNSPEEIENVLGVNTKGTIFLCKAVIPQMRKQKEGTIINIISQDGLTAKENRSLYHASKWAITGFTKCLQKDLSQENIRVTGVFPGLMATSLFEKQGIKRDLSHALDLSEVAKMVEFVINLSPTTLVPEIGIKHLLNNNTSMDNTSNTGLDLNLDPNLITTQGGPQAISPANQALPVTTPPASIVDIPPASTPTSPQIPSEPPTPTVVPIAPEAPLTHLIPEPVTTPAQPENPAPPVSPLPEPSLPPIPPQTVMPETAPIPSAPTTQEPTVSAPSTLSNEQGPATSFTIDSTSPLFENPDDVKLGQ